MVNCKLQLYRKASVCFVTLVSVCTYQRFSQLKRNFSVIYYNQIYVVSTRFNLVGLYIQYIFIVAL